MKLLSHEALVRSILVYFHDIGFLSYFFVQVLKTIHAQGRGES